MGKDGASRRGKKEWRRIDASDLEAAAAAEAADARCGGPLDAVPDADLFFLDKAKAHSPPLRKTERHRRRALRCDSALQRASLVPAVAWPARQKRAGALQGDVTKPPAAKASVSLARARPPKRQQAVSQLNDAKDVWIGAAPQEMSDLPISASTATRKLSKQVPTAAVAVEIDVPGCSYNPSQQSHQDALGVAVAQEMRTMLQKELEPEPVPMTLPEGRPPLSEEEMFYLETAEDKEGDDEEVDGAQPTQVKGQRQTKLTRADLNRRMRRVAAEKLQAEQLVKKRSAKDIARLPELLEELEDNALSLLDRRVRRKIAREEKRLEGPPRLGKQRFKPEPVQVLLTSELTGCLRKLKGCSTLTRERFKSFQRRGIIEPRLPVRRKLRRKRKEVVQGSQGQKEREGHVEILAMQEARRLRGKVASNVGSDSLNS
eukprot:SM000010S04295  [mRNA]  locus=s10:763810:767056:- [translate_table: standard]